jgi:hypothetical protein
MATIKGENLRIFLRPKGAPTGYRAVAAATTCTLHCTLQVEEDSTKDTVDDWIEQSPVGLNWDIQTEALVISDDEETGFTVDQLRVGIPYLIQFARTVGAAGEQNRDKTDSMLNVEGVAILSDLQVNSQNAEIATYTAQFTGHGELEFEEIEERPFDPEGF